MALSVTVIDATSAGLPEDLVPSLAREVLEVELLVPPLPPAPASALALVFLDAGARDETLRGLLRWRAAAGRPCPLLGCAPEGDNGDSERALAAGFDDFVAGRRSHRELAGRLRALARRLEARDGPARLTTGRLTLDATGHELFLGTRRVRLTRLESRTVGALMRAPGHTLSRAQLLEQVWGEGSLETSPRSVDNLVQRLRKKIGEREIVTVRGTGFRLAAP